MITIKLTSVFVADQARALAFYTEVLGFVKKLDIPAGDYRWLTVVSPAEPDGVELLLEPNVHPAAEAYQNAIRADGIAAAAMAVDDIHAESQRLTAQGVAFTMPPTPRRADHNRRLR